MTRDTYAGRDASTVVAEGRAGEFAAAAITHLADRVARHAAELVLLDLIATGVDAETAQPLAEAVRREALSRLDGRAPIRQQPRLTLVPKRTKP